MAKVFQTSRNGKDLDQYPLTVSNRGNGVILVREKIVSSTDTFMNMYADLITYLVDLNPEYYPASQERVTVPGNPVKHIAIVTFVEKLVINPYQ